MIAIMVVSADGENVYHIHLPEYAGAERPVLINYGYKRTEVMNNERKKREDKKYSCYVCGHCSNFLRGMYCEDVSYDDEICGRFKLDEKRKDIIKKEMEKKK